MNYKRVYNLIIEKRRSTPVKDEEYSEKHHIIPRCLGGSNDKNNIVNLTAKEHFICHALLSEMYERGSDEWYKMNHAFMMMRPSSEWHNKNRYYNSRLYEMKKKDFSKVMSKLQKGKNNSQYGKIWIYNKEEESNKKIHPFELDVYLEKEWEKGRVMDFNKLKKNARISKLFDSLEYKNKKYTKRKINAINKAFNLNITCENFNGEIKKLDEYLNKLYNMKLYSTVDIAEIYNLSDPTVLKYLKLFKIKRRSKSDPTERTIKKLSAPKADF